ncbi:TspO/MBR family protein [Adhaeretor mobilis]|uniref:TspO/MBR family protein n=1 Tax=Adhaeretor mobilis TaxID=1930276 RepID=A0A517MY31_9BACT|nr:TspO/MBR family protein [Adhaeretor mobilis]QDS99792.1 TspO/MBR family protein [Adhaeretor mobilis]
MTDSTDSNHGHEQTRLLPKSISKWLSLGVFLVISGAAITIGQFYPPDAWFDSLAKPFFNPPSWVFPVVWTPLYMLIAISGWLLWRHAPKSLAMGFWGAQMILNVLWTIVFFGYHRPGWALIEIVLLWSAIGATILSARSASRTAAILFLPYWVWVGFATLLNAAFWWLNR